MENEADNEQLLADVLSEAVPAEFRGAMLGETLRRVRRRRRWRQTRRAAAALAALGLTAALLWQNWPEQIRRFTAAGKQAGEGRLSARPHTTFARQCHRDHAAADFRTIHCVSRGDWSRSNAPQAIFV